VGISAITQPTRDVSIEGSPSDTGRGRPKCIELQIAHCSSRGATADISVSLRTDRARLELVYARQQSAALCVHRADRLLQGHNLVTPESWRVDLPAPPSNGDDL
jgi:hypothetical protein